MTFGRFATIHERYAIQIAQETADSNGSPCGVWARDGWYTVSEEPPDDIEPAPEESGWSLDTIVEPSSLDCQ